MVAYQRSRGWKKRYVDPEYVLLVDDDDAVRRMTSLVLRAEGLEVRTAAEGASALVLVEEEEPALVILDLHMPVMDGRAFYRALRAGGHQVPVLLLSAESVHTARTELGADAALAKPFDIDELVTQAHTLMHDGVTAVPTDASARSSQRS